MDQAAPERGHALVPRSGLLEALEQFRATPAIAGAPLRFTVQDVYRFDSRRIVAGLVEAGNLLVGDRDRPASRQQALHAGAEGD